MAGTPVRGGGDGDAYKRFEDLRARREAEAAPRRAEIAAALQVAARRPLATKGSLADTGDEADESEEVARQRAQLVEETPAPVITTTPVALPGKGLGLPPADLSTAPMRPVAALNLADAEFRTAPTPPPMVEWMAPADLLIDATYQRDLSDASHRLIRRIAERWDWRRFKPPIVAWTERGFEIIDGQHTAIAAATRGDIEKLPVLVVEAAELQDRAQAFIGHNRDRLRVHVVQIHHAAVAAGDPDALTIRQVCDRAGVTIIRTVFGARQYKPGETIAVGAVGALVQRRHAKGAREVLEVLVKAEVAPISANAIKAVELLMFDEDYAGRFEPEELAKAIQKAGEQAETDARLVVAANSIPLWKGLAATWFKKTRKKT